MVATAILLAASVAVAVASSVVSSTQQNAQLKYQQEVQRQNAIAAQNKAAADMKTRRTETTRAQASTRAAMAATGIDSSSGSFLDLVGQGAAAGELDVLKAKHQGDVDAWSLNNKINELETQKTNVALDATLSGLDAGISAYSKSGMSLSSTKSAGKSVGKTSGNSGMKGVDAMEGTIA